MLEVKFIRENFDLVEKSTKEKGYNVDIKKIIELTASYQKIRMKGQLIETFDCELDDWTYYFEVTKIRFLYNFLKDVKSTYVCFWEKS